MKYIFVIGLIVLGAFVGVILQTISNYLSKEKKKRLKKSGYTIDINCEVCHYDSLLEEWKVTIQTQMHFNDLIIRFRSIVLSVFIASLGFIYGFAKELKFSDDKVVSLIIVAGVFWLCSFILDYFYYHKLLIGAVEHSKKFDTNKHFRKQGLYGLTARIGVEVNPITSKILIWCFYGIPILCLIVLTFLRMNQIL